MIGGGYIDNSRYHADDFPNIHLFASKILA